MMANRVRPGIEQTRPMSRTLNVRKAEWDLIRGNHQGQRQLRCIKQAGHKTAPDLMSKLQKILAMQEPSTQDIAQHISALPGWPSGYRPGFFDSTGLHTNDPSIHELVVALLEPPIGGPKG